jgi:hypothetical protein
MPYPETTTGFAITDPKNWTNFSKQEVRRYEPGFFSNSTANTSIAQTEAL